MVYYVVDGVSAHESALVNIALDAIHASVTRVLPYEIVVAAVEVGLFLRCVLGNHELVCLEVGVGGEVFVVEVLAGVDDGSLAVFVGHEFQKLLQSGMHGCNCHSACYFNVDEWEQVLVAFVHGSPEVLELCRGADSRSEEVVAAHFQSVALCLAKVVVVCIVDQCVRFCCFQIHISCTSAFCHSCTVDTSLIVAHIDAVHVVGDVDELVYLWLSRCVELCVGLCLVVGCRLVGLEHGVWVGLRLFRLLLAGLHRWCDHHQSYDDGHNV